MGVCHVCFPPFCLSCIERQNGGKDRPDCLCCGWWCWTALPLWVESRTHWLYCQWATMQQPAQPCCLSLQAEWHCDHKCINYINQWTSSGVSITVLGLILDVDSMCPVHISSLSDPECASVNLYTHCYILQWRRNRSGSSGFKLLHILGRKLIFITCYKLLIAQARSLGTRLSSSSFLYSTQ